MMDAFFFVPIDSNMVYEADSVDGGAYPVTTGAAAGGGQNGSNLAVPEGVAGDTVVGVAYEASELATGGKVDFGFDVT